MTQMTTICIEIEWIRISLHRRTRVIGLMARHLRVTIDINPFQFEMIDLFIGGLCA